MKKNRDPEADLEPDSHFAVEDEDERVERDDGAAMPATWDDPDKEPAWVEDIRVLARREVFRLAAQMVARELSALACVQRVVLIGSVAAPPVRERRRRRRGSSTQTWHEPKDVDLAVWLTSFDDLTALRRARSRAVAHLLEATDLGVAHHQVDMFLIESPSNEYRGVLCIFGECPKGKRDCSVDRCGEKPFLRQFEDFRFRLQALDPGRTLVLFERGISR